MELHKIFNQSIKLLTMRKYFGGGKTDICPFCGKACEAKNKDGLQVCKKHRESRHPELKCMCGEYVDVVAGKYGNYCTCLRCGNINLQKILEVNDISEE